MTIALDLGSHRVRSLRHTNGKLIARSHRCVYSVLPDSESHRRLLADAGVQFLACDDGLLLLGDAAWEQSDLFHVVPRTVLKDGVIPQDDPVSRQLMAVLVESVLPKAIGRGELCALTLPASDSVTTNGRLNVEFFNRVVRLQGYEPMLVTSGTALIMAELVRSAFTGIALICGASGCEAVLAHRGIVQSEARIARGGDWLDHELAAQFEIANWDASGQRILNTAVVCRARESNDLTLSAGNRLHPEFGSALRTRIESLLTDLLESFAASLLSTHAASEFPQPLPVICGGGLSAMPQLPELLHDALSNFRLPVRTQPARIASHWPHCASRGLLIAAELEAAAQHSQSRAA